MCTSKCLILNVESVFLGVIVSSTNLAGIISFQLQLYIHTRWVPTSYTQS